MKSPLERSIIHWEYNLVIVKESLGKTLLGTDFSMSTYGCALCNEYAASCCSGCPVSEKSGDTACSNTPYEALYKATHRVANPKITKEIIRLVKDEVDFLKSLRPPKKKQMRNRVKDGNKGT